MPRTIKTTRPTKVAAPEIVETPAPTLSQYTMPLLVVTLLILSFFVGSLYTKVQYLEKDKTTGTAQNPGTGQAAAPTKVPEKVNVATGHFPIKGNENAKITIIEFADFRCPFCEKLYTTVEPQILKDYVDTGKAKFAFRQYAFLGPASTLAANAAECANEQGKFWEMYDYLYKNQPDESDTSMYTIDNMTSIAGDLGLDSAQFNSCLSTNKYDKNVSTDLADGQKAGVQATPTLFINGMAIVGSCPLATVDAAIKAEIDGKKWSVNNCQIAY